MTNIRKQSLLISSILAFFLLLFLLLWCLRDNASILSLDEPDLAAVTELYGNHQTQDAINNINPLHYPLSNSMGTGSHYSTSKENSSQGLSYYVLEPPKLLHPMAP